MQKKLLALGLAAVLSGGYTISAFAQAKPDVQVRQRVAVMTLQGKFFGPMGLMNAGKVPYNEAVVQRNAMLLDALSQMPWDNFTEDTKGEKTRALPEIYSNAAGFKKAQDDFRAATMKLVAASKGGEAAAKGAIAEVLNNCNSCHKQFRGN